MAPTTQSATVLTESKCGKDNYFDTGTDGCEPCYPICHLSKHQRTEEDCKTHCPYYVLPEKPANIGKEKILTGDQPTNDANDGPSNMINANPLYIGIAVGGIALIIVLVIIFIVWRRNRRHRPTRERRKVNRIYKKNNGGIQETSFKESNPIAQVVDEGHEQSMKYALAARSGGSLFAEEDHQYKSRLCPSIQADSTETDLMTGPHSHITQEETQLKGTLHGLSQGDDARLALLSEPLSSIV